MRGDRRPVSPTELSQLARCEQQVLFDRRFGVRRSSNWQKRAGEGQAVHRSLHREVTSSREGRRKPMLIAVILVLVVLALFLLLGRSEGAELDRLLPPELEGAELWQSETSLVRKKPVHIRGRPDEVWIKNGRRYIVETKSRAGGVFEGDRMQLAAYAYLLRETDGPALAPHAFVRFTGGGISFSKVKLRDDEAVVEAHRRFQKLTAGRTEARLAKAPAICAGCGHKEQCPDPKTQRLS
jgi:CRISPR/Cas system-associated exonuclease Cas4 (RecB family)